MDRMLPQALPETEELIVTSRVLFAIASDPDEPLDIANLAERSGLTHEAVITALGSREFFDQMAKDVRAMTGLGLRRGISRLTDIVSNGHDREKIQAHRALLETYKTFASDVDPQDAVKALMRLRENMTRARSKIKVVDASSRTTHDRSQTPNQAED